jgi:hypothetical protein
VRRDVPDRWCCRRKAIHRSIRGCTCVASAQYALSWMFHAEVIHNQPRSGSGRAARVSIRPQAAYSTNETPLVE